MNPLWKNLLYLHGHIAHAGLAWKPDARLPPDRRRTVGAISKPGAMVRLSCAAVWPRLIAPR